MYTCDKCDFSSEYKSNYSRHVRMCGVTAMFKCKYCEVNYKTHAGMINHHLKCTLRDSYELKLELANKTLQEKMELADKASQEKLAASKEQINSLKLEIIELKNQLSSDRKDLNEIAKHSSVQVTNNSINVASETALQYITRQYPNAPVLERKDIPKLIEYDNTKGPEKRKLAEEWIYAEKHSSLVPFIGKIIVNLYKPEDPTLQPVWNSDVERLTFYRRVLNDKNIATWVSDKQGIDICKEIIKPMLQHIEQQLVAYTTSAPTAEDLERYGSALADYVILAHKIIDKIRDGQLEKMVLKYCAPYFAINKSSDDLIISNKTSKKKLIKASKVNTLTLDDDDIITNKDNTIIIAKTNKDKDKDKADKTDKKQKDKN